MPNRDAASIDTIIEALYDVISGPAAQSRDWDRLRALFLDGARMVRTTPALEGAPQTSNQTVDAFIEEADAFLQDQDFFESEVARQTERFGQIAHVFSTYESRLSPEADVPAARGIQQHPTVLRRRPVVGRKHALGQRAGGPSDSGEVPSGRDLLNTE